MRKPIRYPLGQRYRLLGVETFYATLDNGPFVVVATGKPVALSPGHPVEVIDPGPLYASYVRKALLKADDRVLCSAEVDGLTVYAWVLLSWLEPATAQGVLFETAQPSLF
jgi:hypothetical protein